MGLGWVDGRSRTVNKSLRTASMVSKVLLFDGSSGCVHFALGQISGIPWVRVEDRAGWEWHRARARAKAHGRTGRNHLDTAATKARARA